MANDSQSASQTTQHPAPHRDKVSLGSLWFGLCATPVAWIGLELFSYVLSMGVCTAKSNVHSGTTWSAMLAACIVAGLLALAATAVSVSNWRKTRHESKGSAHNLLEVGEGRTRFLAMLGLLTCAGFIVAFIFSATTLLVVPLCK
jgi:hypothetical protein